MPTSTHIVGAVDFVIDKATKRIKTVRGVDGMMSTQTAQALQPTSRLGDRFVFEGERLFDKVACRYYVLERRLVERVNEKLEQAVKLTELTVFDGMLCSTAERIRALKETL